MKATEGGIMKDPTVFYGGAREAWLYVQATDAKPAAKANSTWFYALPVELRRGSDDNGCCCPYCSRDPKKTEAHGPVWDSLAVGDLTAWLVHHPRINGRRRLRPLDRNQEEREP